MNTYIVEISVQVVVKAPNDKIAQENAFRHAKALISHPSVHVSGAQTIRETNQPPFEVVK